jgi:hypothetical protein
LGQKQTSEGVEAMSALPPKADIETQSRDVKLCAKSGHQFSFVGEDESTL